MNDVIQHLINGLCYGSTIALIALGYTMVFGILQFINFAHGDVFMLGCFAGYYIAKFFHLMDHPGFFSLLLTLSGSIIFCAFIGYIIERFAYRPLRNSPKINILITAVGVSLLLEFAGQLIFGPDPKFFPTIFRLNVNWNFGEIIIEPIQVLVFGIALILMGILQFLVFKTRFGRAMRAVSFNHDLASLMGIPTDTIISLTFMIGSSLAGAGGVLFGIVYPRIDPLMGVMLGLKSFVAAVFGGIGNVKGAVLGAVLLALAEEFVVAYTVSTYRDAIAFGILILILLIRPTGLLGAKELKKV